MSFELMVLFVDTDKKVHVLLCVVTKVYFWF